MTVEVDDLLLRELRSGTLPPLELRRDSADRRELADVDVDSAH